MELQGSPVVQAAPEAAAAAPSSTAGVAAGPALQPSSGQQGIGTYVQACPAVIERSSYAPVACACGCAGSAGAHGCTGEHRSGDRHAYCLLCTTRIQSKQPSRPYRSGRAHDKCIKAKERRVEPAPGNPTASAAPKQRVKRPYDTLGPTQQWKRRKQALADITNTLQQVGCPLDAIHSPPTPSPAELIHLPTSTREAIRSVPSLHIPCEQTMIACKQQLATSHATETGTFAGGAFITDPVRFVSGLCAQSPFIAVGGDAGGGRCVLGVTYSIPTPIAACPEKTTQHFACLLVYEGGDSWLELQDCRAEGLTPFTGDSAAFPHIWAVLQHLIDTRSAFLNGDWPFINAVLGLMAPSATHPCPICIVGKNNLLSSSRYRTPADKHSIDRSHSPLLTIDPTRIVPTPLHLFIGISNRIILDAFSELLGKERVESALTAVTTVHSAGCGGKSDLYDLNGPEISKWIKRKCSASVLAAAASSSALPAAITASHSILSRWLQQLHHCLLRSDDWTAADIDAWHSAVSDIHSNWQAETSIAAFPKLHMLHHSVDFAERHRFLGRASEAQIESYHASFNALFHRQHLNQGSNTAERLRRSLADATLRAVQPLLSASSSAPSTPF